MDREARKVIQDHLDSIVATVKPYPKPYRRDPYGRRPYYERTGRLGRGWRTSIHKRARGYAGAIYNITPYATFVQGPYQVPIHRGRGWKALEDYLDREGLQRKVTRFARKLIWNVPLGS